MKQLPVRFIAQETFISEAIRFETFSKLSHVELGTSKGTWIGAHLKGGVQERPKDYCKPSIEMIYGLSLPDLMYEAVIGDAYKAIGCTYDLRDIFGLALHIDLDKHPSPHQFICSMFVINILQKYGIKLLNVLPEFCHLVTPETLHLSPSFIGKRISYYNSKDDKKTN